MPKIMSVHGLAFTGKDVRLVIDVEDPKTRMLASKSYTGKDFFECFEKVKEEFKK